MPVSIIGTRGCGKSTFVGFLQQSMEKYTNRNPEKFSYFMDAKTTDVCLNKIRNRLLGGQFPMATARGDFDKLDFLTCFETTKKDRLKGILDPKKGITNLRGALSAYENLLILTIWDVAGEEIQESWRGVDRLSKDIKDIFDTNIMVLLIDCMKLTRDIKSEKASRMRRYDAEMARVMSYYEEYRAKTHPGAELHPIVVFTKMDTMDQEIIKDLPNHSLNDLLNPDKEYDEDEVKEDGDKLLSQYLPGIYSNILGSAIVDVDLREAKYFFSWAGMEGEDGVTNVDGELDRTWKTIEPEGDVNPEDKVEVQSNIYPWKHYREFISHLGDLSKEYSDKREKVMKYLDEAKKK